MKKNAFLLKSPGPSLVYLLQNNLDFGIQIQIITIQSWIVSKSLYISHAVSISYGTEIQIQTGFGSVGITDFEGSFFKFSWAKKFKKHCSVCTKELHKTMVNKI